jgi:molybdate transport system substrate-binding protein
VIEVLSSVGLRAAIEKLSPAGCRIRYGTGAALEREIGAGATFDVALLFPDMLERIGAVPSQAVAKSWLSLGVRAGIRAPDISSVAALRGALLAAKSIAYSKDGKSGMLMAAIVERLGLAAELAPKTIRETRPGGAAFNLAEGRAELAFTIASEIVPVAGARLAGRLPPEVGQCVTFASGFSRGADTVAAQAFVALLRSPAAAQAFESSGLELP